MSNGVVSFFGKVLFWRYARGSWQYDILCALILAFIFLTPKGVFDGSYFVDETSEGAESSTQAEQSADQEPSSPNPPGKTP